MSLIVYLLFVLIFFLNTTLHASQTLTTTNIVRMANIPSLYLPNPADDQKISFFKLLDFIKYAPSSLQENAKINVVDQLRATLNDANISTNLTTIDVTAIEHIKKRLMYEEINLFRRFGVPNLNFMPGGHTENQLAAQTINLSKIVGRVVARDGVATGTLIAIPSNNIPGQNYIWAVLTCGHIIDHIGCNKDDAADIDAFNFRLQIAGASVVLPIRRIKVFKRPNKAFVVTDIGTLPPNPENSVMFPEHVRALPRYDDAADLAVCFLDNDAIVTAGQTVNTYLNARFPVTTNPQITADELTFSITHLANSNATNYLLKFVDNDATPLITEMNSANRNKREIYSLGYAEFDAQSNPFPTLSGSRSDRLSILNPVSNIINDLPGEFSEYNFFHDIPTYSGMSGGPIFHVHRATNTVTIFGIVQSHNEPDGLIINVAEKSRCQGGFLKRNLLI